MRKKVLFIVNPKSGKGTIRAKLLDIVDIFVKAEFDLTLYISQAAGDARVKALETASKYDLIICSGGDGTLDEVINGVMMAENAKCKVGYIPSGSTNDFANSLKLPKEMLAAAESITQWKEFPCDVGVFNDKYFVYIAAFGLFTEVSYGTNQDIKNILGHVAYLLQGVKSLMSIQTYQMKVEADEMTVEGSFIYGMVTNSTSVGGFQNITGKNVLLDDGVFEVTLIKTPKDIIQLNEILAALIAGKPDDNHFYQFRSKHVKFTAEQEVPWTLDGEFGGNHKEVDIWNEEKALTLLV